jgi:hypothetical protein
MAPETRVILANCAASFLLLLVFVLLLLASAALLLCLRGLRIARRASPDQVARLVVATRRAGDQARDTASRVVEPQIRLASTWIGAKVAVRAFLMGERVVSRDGAEDDTHG